ncbi:MAG: hypothetical protein M3313_04470 [Actinomycetota bacterium]|nr:hypothetical protein [Actinomycetota bacterium]
MEENDALRSITDEWTAEARRRAAVLQDQAAVLQDQADKLNQITES